MEDTEVTNFQIVQAALGGDPVETERLFTTKLNGVIAGRVDSMRADVASTILTAEPTTDDGSSE